MCFRFAGALHCGFFICIAFRFYCSSMLFLFVFALDFLFVLVLLVFFVVFFVLMGGLVGGHVFLVMSFHRYCFVH